MIYYSNLNSKQIKLRIFLLLVFLLFPKGIGIIVPNLAVFDINKSAYLLLVFIVILNIFNKHKHSFFLNHIDLFVLLIIVYSASTFFFWINFNQIIEYMYFLIFGVFAYLLAKNLFQNEFIFMFFINTFYKYLLFTSLFGLLFFFFDFSIIDYFRPDPKTFSLLKSRGDVLGSGLIIDAYRGFHYSNNQFGWERLIFLSLGVFVFLSKTLSKEIQNKKFFLFSLMIIFIEIILNQSRLTTVIAIFVYLVFFIVQIKRGESNKINSILIVFLLLTFLLKKDFFLYYFESVKSIISVFGFTLEQNFKYNLETDKRYLVISNFFNFELFSAYGPRFFLYSPYIYDIPRDNWDDVSPLITLYVAYGLPIIALFILLLFFLFIKKKNCIGWIGFLILIIIIIASINGYKSMFYFYFFFFVGLIVSYTSKIKNKYMFKK